MEDKRHMDNELREAFRKIEKPVPGSDFTSAVMSKINEEAPVAVTAYSPVFGRGAWLAFAAFLFAILLLVVFGESGEPSVIAGYLSRPEIDLTPGILGGLGTMLSNVLTSSVLTISLLGLLGAGLINALLFRRINRYVA